MNENMHAYNELEFLAQEQFSKYGVSLFRELPENVQNELIHQQTVVFKKWGVTMDDFPIDDPFIAAD
jgi:hypothetical protein